VSRARVVTGLEAYLAHPPRPLAKARLGLLCNQASVDTRLRHARDLVAKSAGRRLAALFSPQHGIFGEKQDNMVESPHGRDPVLGIPVFSLYADVRRPTGQMLAGVDALLVDLQDVGCRVYTFITTLRYCLEEASKLGKKVVVLDRPNPIGGAVEGNLLDAGMVSFVGAHRLPIRHGLTPGELARLFVADAGIDVDLDVVPLRGWRRRPLFADTACRVPPSPNMPTPAALVYPGRSCLRTLPRRRAPRPFEPAARLDRARARVQRAAPAPAPGALSRGLVQPTSRMRAGSAADSRSVPRAYRPYRTTLTILAEILGCGPATSAPANGEYETTRLPRPAGREPARARRARGPAADHGPGTVLVARDRRLRRKCRRLPSVPMSR
jgi:hypothetical protein